MLQALLQTFREGLVAFVVIGVMLAFFRRLNHPLDRAVRLAIVMAVVTSGAAAALFATADNQALWEGLLAIAGAMAVVVLATYMRRVPRGERNPGVAMKIATVLIALLLITRGGMEIALMIGTLVAQVPSANLLIAIVAGLVLSLIVSWLWTYVATRLGTWLLFHVTAAFLVLFCAHLFVDGVHELSESGVVPGSDALHVATEPYSSEGIYGRHAPFVLVAGPVVWGVVAIFWGYGKTSDVRDAEVD